MPTQAEIQQKKQEIFEKAVKTTKTDMTSLIQGIKPALKGYSSSTKPIDVRLSRDILRHISAHIKIKLENIFIPKIQTKLDHMKKMKVSWWKRRELRKIRDELISVKNYHQGIAKSGRLPSVVGRKYNLQGYLKPFEIIQGKLAIIEQTF